VQCREYRLISPAPAANLKPLRLPVGAPSQQLLTLLDTFLSANQDKGPNTAKWPIGLTAWSSDMQDLPPSFAPHCDFNIGSLANMTKPDRSWKLPPRKCGCTHLPIQTSSPQQFCKEIGVKAKLHPSPLSSNKNGTPPSRRIPHGNRKIAVIWVLLQNRSYTAGNQDSVQCAKEPLEFPAMMKRLEKEDCNRTAYRLSPSIEKSALMMLISTRSI